MYAVQTVKVNFKSAQPSKVETVDGVRSHLTAIGRVQMLTHDEEIELGRLVQKWQPIAEYHDANPDLTREQLAQYFGLSLLELDRIELTGRRAKKRMVEANLRLVVSIAKKFQDRGLDLIDLIQEGSLGLERGVEKFDPSKGYRFSTYAYWWIRQAVSRAVAEKARTIRLPIHITEKLGKIKTQIKKFQIQNKRLPTQQELADRLKISVEELAYYLALKKNTCSLNKMVGDNQDTELIDLLKSPESDVFDEVAAENTREVLYSVMRDHLTEKEFEVISMRFGFNGEPMALHQIGHFMGISRKKVWQVERIAINKLRKTEVAKQLGGLIDRSSAK